MRRTHPRKSFFKPFMSLIGITTLVFLTSGFNTFNAHKLNGGAIGRQYWLDGSVNSTLAARITSSKKSWGSATALISIFESSNVSDSEILFFESSTLLATGSCGLAVLTDNGLNKIDQFTQNWSRAKVLLADTVKNDGFACPNGRGIITHELGHVFGLAHVTSGVAVMRDDIAGLLITVPKDDDIEGIDFLY